MAALAEFVVPQSPARLVPDWVCGPLDFSGLPMPVVVRLEAPVTDEELLDLSRQNRTYRIERNAKGELEIMSPVASKGGHLEFFIAGELYLWIREHGGLAFSSSSGFTLPDRSVRSADLAWISESRWNALSEAQQSRYAAICPDFVTEILSETDRRATLEAKMEMWIANGAQLAWMIDPFAATVSIYRPEAAVEVLERPEFVEAGEPVAGFRLVMSRLWASKSPQP
jgi:Uma2 family endonuclease